MRNAYPPLCHYALHIKTERHWRKLEWTRVRGVPRGGSSEWQTVSFGPVGPPTSPISSAIAVPWTTDKGLSDAEHLQQALDWERGMHNHLYPSQASDCASRPPCRPTPNCLHRGGISSPNSNWLCSTCSGSMIAWRHSPSSARSVRQLKSVWASGCTRTQAYPAAIRAANEAQRAHLEAEIERQNVRTGRAL